MTDELKPCPFCGGRPWYTIKVEAADEWNTPDVQAAIDAALYDAANAIRENMDDPFYATRAMGIVTRRLGANPLAEAQARIAELEEKSAALEGNRNFWKSNCAERDILITDLQQKNLELARHNMELRDRVTELERDAYDMVCRQCIIQDGLLGDERGNPYCRLERELTEARKDRRRLAAMMPLFQEARDAICYIPLTTAKLRGLDLTLADRMDTVGIKEKWEEYDAAMRQEGE